MPTEWGSGKAEDEKSKSKIIWVFATWCPPTECKSQKAEGGIQKMRNQSLK